MIVFDGFVISGNHHQINHLLVVMSMNREFSKDEVEEFLALLEYVNRLTLLVQKFAPDLSY